MQNKTISVAPMMDWTDRHCRFFHRLLSPHALLYTEMVTTGALIHGDAERHLRFDAAEHPIALQLGGSEPTDLATAAKMGVQYGYDEINLNCGCPSERVQKGAFGACLMREEKLVADCVAAMRDVTDIPITIKCRIGVDDDHERDRLWQFVETAAKAGCETFIVHARKAWLKGLSPKENREIPPLNYALVAQLKQEFPQLRIMLNGGVQTVPDIQAHLQTFDGVMIGRAAYQTPRLLQDIESTLYGVTPLPLEDIIERMIVYAEKQKSKYGTPLQTITRHMVGLPNGQRGARRWRQILTVDSHTGTPRDVLTAALEAVKNPALIAA